MSNVIEFLERVGGDSDLRYADSSAMKNALQNSQISALVADAIVNEDVVKLADTIGAAPNVCCGLYPAESEQKVA